MPKLKPRLQHCYGVPYNTFNPTNKTIFFQGAKLHSAGDSLRAALKEHEEFNENRSKLIQLREKPTDQQDQEKIKELEQITTAQKEREIYLKIIRESLKNQYDVIYESKEESDKYASAQEEQIWLDTLGNYIGDDDLFPIILSIMNKKTFSPESAMEFVREQAKSMEKK